MNITTNSSTTDETPIVDEATAETATNTPTTTGETPEVTNDTTLTADERTKLRADLKRANSEAKTYREKATELDRLKAELEASKLSDTEKLQKSNAELQKKYDDLFSTSQTRMINSEVQLKAIELNIISPRAASKLIDHSAIEYDADGNPTNIVDLLKDLLKAEPYLAGAKTVAAVATTSGGATNPARSNSTAPAALSYEAISKMDRTEYIARRAEIQKWQTANPRRF